MNPKFLPAESLGQFLQTALEGRRVFGPKRTEAGPRLAQMDPAEIQLPPARTVDPAKCLFFHPRQDVGAYFEDGQAPACEPRALVGATACDLAGLEVLDWVFLQGDYVDAHYQARRRETLVLSMDCQESREACFCTFLEGTPYPETGYDLNFSAVDDGFLVEAGTEAGEQLLQQSAPLLGEAEPPQIEQSRQRRGEVADQVAGQVAAAGLNGTEALQETVRDSREAELWGELADSCVECGACNFICPTCHCFLLVDLQEREGFRRFRNWDACLYPAFALEASGANPRARRAERLHGRLEKKFDFIRENTGQWGCTGCGRCVEACAGSIDVRETLKELTHANA